MELAHQMKRRRLLLRARWLPRLQNQEADDLTNYEYRHFDKEKRIPVDLAKLDFRVMNELFRVGDAYLEELEAHRAAAKRKAELAGRTGDAEDRKDKRRKPLCVTDPWK